VVQPELGPPLRERHPGLGAEQPAQGPLARADGPAEVGQTAVTAGLPGHQGRYFAQALIGRPRQVELEGRGQSELAQHDPLHVLLFFGRAVRIVGDGDDQLTEQAGDAEHGRLDQSERIDVHREGHGAQLRGAIGLVRVRDGRRQPHGALRGYDPRAGGRGDDQHAAAGIGELLLGVIVPVDALVMAQLGPGRPIERMAVHRHSWSAYG
jgi:hypothetical protein